MRIKNRAKGKSKIAEDFIADVPLPVPLDGILVFETRAGQQSIVSSRILREFLDLQLLFSSSAWDRPGSSVPATSPTT